MTTLNRDQIATYRRMWSDTPPVQALCDMATRLLDLCEAEPVAWLADAGIGGGITTDARADWIAKYPHLVTPLIPRPESKT